MWIWAINQLRKRVFIEESSSATLCCHRPAVNRKPQDADMPTYANNTSVEVFYHSAETYYVRTVKNPRVEAHADAIVAASRTR